MPSPQKANRTDSVFMRRTQANTLGANVAVIFNHVLNTDGQIGLEVEVEGNKFPKEFDLTPAGIYEPSKHIPDGWKYTHDGSLRGEDNAEYVFDGPQTFEQSFVLIDKLWEMFDNYGSILDDSNRTSVHVHLNVHDWYLNRLCSFIGLYYIVEDVLTHWCGDHRVGNMFCLRAKDAPAIVSKLKQFFKSEHGWVLDQGMHYSGLNAHALSKLGTIEIRTMRGVKDPDTIKTWIGILERLYKLSEEYPDPRDIVHGFSGQSRYSFLSSVLGPFTDQIVKECGMTYEQLEKSLHEGVRIAQDLCYCRNWSKYKPIDCKPDVFGRSPVNAGEMPAPVASNDLTEYLVSGLSGGLNPTTTYDADTTLLYEDIWGDDEEEYFEEEEEEEEDYAPI